MTTEAAGHPAAKTNTFLGHPRGLFYLFSTELWERYAYYGMVAILVLYMQNHLFQPGHAEHVLLYAPVKRGLESVFGPLSAQAMASQVYGIYGFLTYAAPLLGGIVADRFLGQRKAVLVGAIFLSAGYFALSVESLFFVGFPLVFLGNGLFKPNISTQVGNMYAPGDLKRDSAFSIFYVGINIGGIMGPLICGSLGEEVAWRYGFIAAGVGIAGGLLIYLRGLRELPQDALTKTREGLTEKKPFGAEEWQAVWALVGLAFLNVFFWAAWYLQFNIMNTWADVSTERHLAMFDFTVPTTWFQTINGVFILSLTPFVTSLWARQARRGREPSTATKMAIGCVLLGLSFLFMLLPVATMGADGKANLWWLVAFYAIYTLGELYVSPIGLALVTKVAPARIVSMMMGLWLLSYAIGNFIAGYVGSLWEKMSMSSFFILSAAIPIAAGVAIWAVSRPLRPILERAQPDDALTPGVV
ncbi:MAG TPA: peptide MFS transporter [Alphaproteobacteria bacterium]|jgi:POT family proton-dependent oligopeptide transporter|nr:peptide MFS transporter [Alphaproteobacteria bacterium]